METEQRVFADANYFVALFNPADSLKAQALAVAQDISDSGITLVISNFIFLEIVTILSQKADRAISIGAGQYLLKNKRIEIIHIDEQLHQQTWELFQKVDHKNISFVDCSTLVILQAENISRLLTFDHTDFAKLKRYQRFSLYTI